MNSDRFFQQAQEQVVVADAMEIEIYEKCRQEQAIVDAIMVSVRRRSAGCSTGREKDE